MEGYAYILTHPGTPCIFWKHLFDPGLKESISNISRARKAAGVHRTSRVDVAIAENDCYLAYIEDGKLAVKIGPRFDLGASCPDPKMYDLVASGSDFAVWLKKGA